MSLGHTYWQRRRKRMGRRIARDLRLAAPLIGLAVCFAGSAGVISAAQHALVERPAPAQEALRAERPPVGAPPPNTSRGETGAGCPSTNVPTPEAAAR